MRPGPEVTAMRSTSSSVLPARVRASCRTGMTCTTWLRLASSGTTPPQRRWMSTWVETTSESTRRPSSTRAAAVSSQEVSIPSTSKSNLSPQEPAAHLLSERLERGAHVVGVWALGLQREIALVGVDRLLVLLDHLPAHAQAEPRMGVVGLVLQRVLQQLDGLAVARI